MNFQNLFDQVLGGGSSTDSQPDQQNSSSPLNSIKSAIPGGLAGGAAAGGMMALLMGNKSARKMAGKAAKYGGTALLGGLAYKAYHNWQQNQSPQQTQPVTAEDIEQAQAVIPQHLDSNESSLHLTLIKSMIAAAKADGHIDPTEQQHIFDAVEKMQINADEKAIVFDSLRQSISIEEIAHAVTSVEHKAEVYLAGYMAIDPDHPAEVAHLNELAVALQLDPEFVAHLEQQVETGIAATA